MEMDYSKLKKISFCSSKISRENLRDVARLATDETLFISEGN